MVLSLTLMPVLASLMLPKRVEEREPFLMRIAHITIAPAVCMEHKFIVVGVTLCVYCSCLG